MNFMKRIQHIQMLIQLLLTSRKPLQYFPDDYNGSISSLRVIDEAKGRGSKLE